MKNFYHSACFVASYLFFPHKKRTSHLFLCSLLTLSFACSNKKKGSSAPAHNKNPDSIDIILDGDEKGSKDPAGDGFSLSLQRRLTHEQFFTQAYEVFFPAQSPNIASLEKNLVAETESSGLKNDATHQTLSQVLFSGYLNFATTMAQKLVAPLSSKSEVRSLTGCQEDDLLADCVSLYLFEKAEKAFRSPLSESQKDLFTNLMDQVNTDLDGESSLIRAKAILESGAMAILTSPFFLSIIEIGTPNGDGTYALNDYEIATRLSLLLSPKLPDAKLLQKAKDGLLHDPKERILELERLFQKDDVKDALVAKMKSFFGIDLSGKELGDDLASETRKEALKKEALEDFDGFLRSFLFEDKPFSTLYREKADFKDAERKSIDLSAGALGTVAYVASHTSKGTPAPITRGNFTLQRLLCYSLPLPPADIPPAPAPEEGVSDRDWLEAHRNDSCASCHEMIDNFGLPFENFDAASIFSNDADTSAQLPSAFDISGPISSLENLADAMSESEQSKECFTSYWYRHAYGKSLLEEDMPYVNKLKDEWQANSFFELLAAIVASDDFVTLSADE